MVSKIEGQWRIRFGNDVIEALHEALHDAFPTMVATMPWSPPEIHSSDGFYTHVVAGVTFDNERPLVALLGQTLTHFTLDHEKEAAVSLPLGTCIRRGR